MQDISVILAHPYTHSLNAAIAATVVSTLEKNGYGVYFHDLYQEGFDPLLSEEELAAGKSNDPLLRQNQEEISRAHVLLLVEKCGFRTYINIKKKSAVRTFSFWLRSAVSELTSTSRRNQPCARHHHRPPQLVGAAARYPQRLDGACSAEKRRLHLSTGR